MGRGDCMIEGSEVPNLNLPRDHGPELGQLPAHNNLVEFLEFLEATKRQIKALEFAIDQIVLLINDILYYYSSPLDQ
jgi:hypothetical protein